MADLSVSAEVSIQDTKLFQDIIDLIKKHGENDSEMMKELTAIMNKHSTEYEYIYNKNNKAAVNDDRFLCLRPADVKHRA